MEDKFKSFTYMTVIEFYKEWQYDKDSRIVIFEHNDDKIPCYVGKAIQVPIIYADRFIKRFEYPDEKFPILYLKEPSIKIESIYRDW